MRKMTFGVVLLLALSACSSPAGDGSGTATGSPVAASTPVSSRRPSATASRTPTPTPFIAKTEAVLPSPTPVTYTVLKGDTMSGIAQKFGVTLKALQDANPGVNPNAMPVGTILVIPVGGNLPDNPTPTPVPLTIRQTRCYPTAEGGLWCLALVENGYVETVENLSILFTLIDPAGQEVASQVAYAPLNIVPPGRAMPVAVFFPAPVPEGAAASVQILTAIRILPGDQRYLPAALQNTLVQVDWFGRTAQISGHVLLTAQAGPANTLWVLAVAYDEHGNLVGFKRWDSAAPLESGSSLEFDFQVSSLGLGIERVELMVEARP